MLDMQRTMAKMWKKSQEREEALVEERRAATAETAPRMPATGRGEATRGTLRGREPPRKTQKRRGGTLQTRGERSNQGTPPNGNNVTRLDHLDIFVSQMEKIPNNSWGTHLMPLLNNTSKTAVAPLS